MTEKFDRNECILLLREMHERLAASGEARYPRRGDFDDRSVEAIKAHLGPWPRALEAAGIKPPRKDGKAERALKKRIRAKRARTAARKAQALVVKEGGEAVCDESADTDNPDADRPPHS